VSTESVPILIEGVLLAVCAGIFISGWCWHRQEANWFGASCYCGWEFEGDDEQEVFRKVEAHHDIHHGEEEVIK